MRAKKQPSSERARPLSAAACPGARDIALLIGPEGGIAPEEAREAEARGAKLVTLGPRILRAETAAIASAAAVMTLWWDL